MTPSQGENAVQAIMDLQFGTDTLIDQSRVSLEMVQNKPMPLESAIHCINQIATMTKQWIVSGPFDAPPFPEFRANLLFVVQ